MLDKILAVISLAALIGFMLIVLIWINEIDLWIISVVVLLMAVFDFFYETRNAGGSSKE